MKVQIRSQQILILTCKVISVLRLKRFPFVFILGFKIEKISLRFYSVSYQIMTLLLH
jgi:hypothetical protein